MSIETITTDDFMSLTLEDHEEALALYDQAIFNASQGLVAPDVDLGDFAAGRDQLTRYVTLRKVHQGRYNEMVEEMLAEAEAETTKPAAPLFTTHQL